MNSRLMFYKVRTGEVDSELTDEELYDKVYKKTLQSLNKMYETMGWDNGSLHPTNPDTFPMRAESAAQIAVEWRHPHLTIYSVAVDDECYDEVVKETEAISNFRGWVKSSRGKDNE